MAVTRTFWILQWPDGTYYRLGRGECSGWDAIKGTTDPMLAERYASAEDAKAFHDSRGHFYHQHMHAVPITLTITDGDAVDLPARARSTHDEDDRS